MERALKTYTKKERNFFLAGLTGQNFIYNIIGVGLALYYTEALYIPTAIVATLMLVARLWDAFNDLFMGVLVDRTKSRWGKCRPYLMIVPFFILLITIALFSATFNYNTNPVLTIVFIYITYIIWGMIYTIGDIPLWGITALMTESEKDRTKLLSLARIFGSIGSAVVLLSYVTVVGLFRNMGITFIFPSTIAFGYFMATLVFVLIGYILFQPLGFIVNEKIPPTYESTSIVKNFKLIKQNKPFIQIMISGILGSTKLMMVTASGYLILWYYANGDETATMFYYAVIGGGFFVGNLLAMYFTPSLLNWISKKNLHNWSNIISVIPFGIAFLLFLYNLDTIPVMAFLIFFAGALQGFPIVLQTTIIADSIDYLEWKSGEKADGLCFAGQTFITKLQSAIAYYGALMLLSYVGYDSKAMQTFVEGGGIARLEYPEVMIAMAASITILPAIGSLLSVIPMWKYCLTEKKHEKILAELNQRRRDREVL